jgi:hypothetical protein
MSPTASPRNMPWPHPRTKMTGSVRIVLVTAALVATLLSSASPALAQSGEGGTATVSPHRPPAGSEKSRVTSPGGIDGVALDLGYVGEPESPIPPVLPSTRASDSKAIAVAVVLLVSGLVLLLGGATFMVITLVRGSRRERRADAMRFMQDIERDV